MSLVLKIVGLLSVVLGVYIAATSVVTDIQIGLVLTAFIGGVGLLGLSSLADTADAILRELRNAVARSQPEAVDTRRWSKKDREEWERRQQEGHSEE
jgi:hypothetical protein